jgi:hypothetical protein
MSDDGTHISTLQSNRYEIKETVNTSNIVAMYSNLNRSKSDL